MSWIRISVKSTLVLLVTLLVLLPGSVSASGPLMLVPYEGFLTNAAGQPINAVQTMTFRFFSDETGGASLFEESKDVTVEDGVFQTNIGDASAIPTGLASRELFLEIQISGDSSPLSPRQQVRIPGTPSPEVIVTSVTDADTLAALFEGRRARPGPSIVQILDTAVILRGRGFDGTFYHPLADIRFGVDGEPGSNDMPGRIEFRTTPDGSDTLEKRMLIDSLGNVSIGVGDRKQLLSLGSAKSKIGVSTIADDEHSTLQLRRARAGTTLVADDDKLGVVNGRGFDGNNYEKAASIRFVVDGTPGEDDMPGRIEFKTTPDGSNVMVERMRIDNTGNVGIGTTNPKQLLDLSSDRTKISVTTISDDNNSTLRFRRANASLDPLESGDKLGVVNGRGFDGTDYEKAASIRFVVDGGVSENDMPGRIEFKTTPDGSNVMIERMRIDNAGNVGIGTTDPKQQLHLSSSKSRIGIYTISDVEQSALTLRRARAGVVQVELDDPLGTINARGFDGTDYERAASIKFNVDGDPGPDDMPGRIRFLTTPDGSNVMVERMRIDNQGNIGIGTTTPTERLEVSGGNIRVSGGGSFIEDGGTLVPPDYVFEKDYPLMSLEELREYVTKEKHLPNVPSTEDIKANGLNLGEFQMRLLEKVEELTLYTLQQEQTLLVQQRQIERLQATREGAEGGQAKLNSSSGSSVGTEIFVYLGAVASSLLIIMVGGWYTRSRWLRSN